MWFYSVIVISDLLVAIGVYLLNVVLWIMKRVIYINMKLKKEKVSKAEKKVILALCSLIFFAVLILF